MLFSNAQDILQKTEIIILKETNITGKISSFLVRHFRFPFSLVRLGSRIITGRFIKFILLFCLIALVFMRLQSIKLPYSENVIVLVAFIISFILSLLSPPSLFASNKIDENLIEYVRLVVESKLQENIDKILSLDCIKENINIFELRAKQWVAGLRIMVSGYWAVIIFLLKEIFSNPNLIDISFGFAVIIGLAMFYFVETYAKAKEIIFDTINYAINEIKSNLFQQSTQEK